MNERYETGLIIRAARREDGGDLTLMANLPGVRHGTARLPFTTQSAIEGRLEAPGVNLLVAELEGTVVAQAFLMQQSGRRSHVGYTGIYVHDDHTGQGIGTKLIEALLDLADNWLGLRRMELTVNVDNADAVKLYERFGFEREGTKRGDILRDGAFVDCHMMARLKDAPSFV
ncbi:GNAT family N-acetyltransferase [Parasulfitobacter algicola]|uniref:GNAT family N-acetyltransferase n=1 Tax=Parasulfitobacter algicola TaxID=2614809 RepID=A0ABX2IW16_9RHOB|nr:GNAT family N-acetyltransferase [Sulfitobacter algicola]NSX56201.1 GNAT family N-acetyltransferase [Sulfitobacter algicola]